MKKIIILLISSIFLFSCEEQHHEIIDYSITAIYYKSLDGWGHPTISLPTGICEYRYDKGRITQDSCGKYKIGDRIR